MFDLNPSDTFPALVETNTVMPSGGWRKESFKAQFKRTFEDQREELLALSNVELLRRVMVGWEMEDLQRKPVPFTPETFEAFLQMVGPVRDAMLSYWKHNAGAKEKN